MTVRDQLDELVEQLRGWQDLPDVAHVIATLAVAVSAVVDEGEPAWLLLVAPPSSGKTEAVRMLDDAADAHLDEVTVAGLLSWGRKGKVPRPVGVLTRVRRGLLTFGDLSTLLATSDKGGRDQVFALLRRVYDGRVVRDVGPPSGATVDGALTWEGRLSIVGAVTGAIDDYSTHNQALGSRWLYCRLPDRDTHAKRRAAGLARRGELAQRRQEAWTLASKIIDEARSQLGESEVPAEVLDVIEDAALVCCWGRASVPRHGYGAREIDGPATIEEPMRVIQQLGTMARGLVALGHSTPDTAAICRRIALDSMPATRSAVLRALTLGAANATAGRIGAVAQLSRTVARRALEELEAIGVVSNSADPDVSDMTGHTVTWALSGEDGALIAAVFESDRRERMCPEKRGPNTPTPQVKE